MRAVVVIPVAVCAPVVVTKHECIPSVVLHCVYYSAIMCLLQVSSPSSSSFPVALGEVSSPHAFLLTSSALSGTWAGRFPAISLVSSINQLQVRNSKGTRGYARVLDRVRPTPEKCSVDVVIGTMPLYYCCVCFYWSSYVHVKEHVGVCKYADMQA